MEDLTDAVDAPAKINLFLEVLERRPDGYHNVSLVNQEIDLVDRITVTESERDRDTIAVSGPHADAVPLDTGSNTIGRTLSGIRHDWPAVPPLRIRVEKNIPAGAGLGGGSADAAAFAMEVRCRYLPEVSAEDIIRLLAGIGSDMPFAAVGGTAIVEGRGERVTPVRFRFDTVCYVLVSPPVEVSTAWAYHTLANVEDRPQRDPEKLRAALPAGDYEAFAEGVWNAFEAVVFPEHPELAGLVAMMEQAGCDAVWMTGSGSNLVGLCRDAERAAVAAASLEANMEHPVRVVHPYSRKKPRHAEGKGTECR
jgi:4-diphosphocytidyl-2-C-methyl-D-erythritol kinase